MAFKNIKSLEKAYPALSYKDCFAKSNKDNRPSKTVIEHSSDAANVAEVLSLLYGKYNFVNKWGKILSAIHDAGKISPGFQKKYFGDYLGQKFPEIANLHDSFEKNHAVISNAAIRDYLNEFLDNSISGEIAGIHHGKSEPVKANNSERYGGEKWAKERLKFISKMVAFFGEPPKRNELTHVQQAVLAGFVCISDWIASDESLSCVSEELALDSVGKCGFIKPAIMKRLSFYDIFGFNPNITQEDFIASVNAPGVYILESSTGSGKTEAALYAAYKLMAENHNNGIYFALPTRLTSDRIHDRVQKFTDKICEIRTPVMLAHGSAWLNDEVMQMIFSGGEEMSPGGSWFCPKKRTLLAPFGVGTVDQSLMAVMNVKHYFVRAFGLLGKVVILDEVHSYDIYTGTLLDRLVESLRQMGCSVIILSATLTKGRKKQFFNSDLPENDSYPLISLEQADKVTVKTTELQENKNICFSFNHSRDIQSIANIAVSKASSGQCVLWINNTVAEAQNAYLKIKGTMKEDAFEVGLLHSRFTVEQRRKIEDNWMKKLGKEILSRPKGCILVATQVVEQSVDIDTDYMISELAPMDMLMQRLGRLWRHSREDRPAKLPELLITTGDIGNANDKNSFIEAIGKNNSKVYAPYILWKTWDALKSQTHLEIPAQTRSLLEIVYSKNKNEPSFVCELRKEMEKEAKDLKSRAGGALAGVSLPTIEDDEDNAKTRWSDMPTVDCLLMKNLEDFGHNARITLLSGEKLKVSDLQKNLYVSKQLHRNTVQIARYNFEKEKLSVPKYLGKHFYGQLAVLIVSEDGNLLFNGIATQLFYTDSLGIYKKNSSTEKDKISDKNNYQTGEYDYELDNGWLDSGSY